MRTCNVAIIFESSFLISYLVRWIARVEWLRSLQFLWLRHVCKDLIMHVVPRNWWLRLGPNDIVHVVAVSHHLLFLLFRFRAIYVTMFHLVSDEPRYFRRNEFDRLELVSWVQRVARRPGGLELLAVWLRALDVVVGQIGLRLIELEVELSTLRARDVQVVIDICWSIYFLGDEYCGLSAYINKGSDIMST